jgi:hypothetical protein
MLFGEARFFTSRHIGEAASPNTWTTSIDVVLGLRSILGGAIMPLSGAQPGHLRRQDGVSPHVPEKQTSLDRESLEQLVESQSARIAQLEAILRQLSTAETWSLAWAREHEPWKRIQRVLNQ